MPLKRWRYTCCSGAEEVLATTESCPTCGQPGEYAGWIYDRVESMAIYQKIHGLKPVGTHRALADRLFAELTTTCFYCRGNGLLDGPSEHSYTTCPMCKGNGYFLNADTATADRLRAEVVAEYPDAAAPRGRGDIAGKNVAQELTSGFMVELDESDPKAED